MESAEDLRGLFGFWQAPSCYALMLFLTTQTRTDGSKHALSSKHGGLRVARKQRPRLWDFRGGSYMLARMGGEFCTQKWTEPPSACLRMAPKRRSHLSNAASPWKAKASSAPTKTSEPSFTPEPDLKTQHSTLALRALKFQVYHQTSHLPWPWRLLLILSALSQGASRARITA